MAKMSDSNHQQDTTVNIYRQYTMLEDIHNLHFQKHRNFDNSLNFKQNTKQATKAASMMKAKEPSIVPNVKNDYSTVTEYLRYKINTRPT